MENPNKALHYDGENIAHAIERNWQENDGLFAMRALGFFTAANHLYNEYEQYKQAEFKKKSVFSPTENLNTPLRYNDVFPYLYTLSIELAYKYAVVNHNFKISKINKLNPDSKFEVIAFADTHDLETLHKNFLIAKQNIQTMHESYPEVIILRPLRISANVIKLFEEIIPKLNIINDCYGRYGCPTLSEIKNIKKNNPKKKTSDYLIHNVFKGTGYIFDYNQLYLTTEEIITIKEMFYYIIENVHGFFALSSEVAEDKCNAE